jgi:hypothetical protein
MMKIPVRKNAVLRNIASAAYRTTFSSLNLRLKGLEEVPCPPGSHRLSSAEFHTFWCFVCMCVCVCVCALFLKAETDEG